MRCTDKDCTVSGRYIIMHAPTRIHDQFTNGDVYCFSHVRRLFRETCTVFKDADIRVYRLTQVFRNLREVTR